MKKTLFILLILLSTNAAFSQSNTGISFCGDKNNTVEKEKITEITLTREELLACRKLTVNDENFKITSCSVGMDAAGNYVEVKLNGRYFSGELLGTIKKTNPKKMYVEKVQLVDKDGNKKVGKPLAIIIKD